MPSGHPGAEPPECLLAPPERLDFHDRQVATLSKPMTALQVWNLLRRRPQPFLRAAFRIRDAVSARFGVRRIGGFTTEPVAQAAAGDRLDFFLVEHAAPDLLVLTERDRHLDVMTCISTAGTRVAIVSSVLTHNLFGRAYMLVVGPAHKLIVWNMLRWLRRETGA